MVLLEWMEEQLAEGILTLSSFERYRKELLAGNLIWSPLHDQARPHTDAPAVRGAQHGWWCVCGLRQVPFLILS